jgi:hypothetical protein
MPRIDFTVSGTIVTSPGPPVDSPAGVYFTVISDGFKLKGKSPMAYTLPGDKQVTLKVSYVDAKGHPAQVDGDVKWDTSDATIAAISVPDPSDTFTALVVPGANLGNAQITATADADLGSGVSTLVTPLLITVVAGSAVAGTITPGEPEDIPVA